MASSQPIGVFDFQPSRPKRTPRNKVNEVKEDQSGRFNLRKRTTTVKPYRATRGRKGKSVILGKATEGQHRETTNESQNFAALFDDGMLLTNDTGANEVVVQELDIWQAEAGDSKQVESVPVQREPMIPNTNGATGASEVTIMEVNGTEMQSTVEAHSIQQESMDVNDDDEDQTSAVEDMDVVENAVISEVNSNLAKLEPMEVFDDDEIGHDVDEVSCQDEGQTWDGDEGEIPEEADAEMSPVIAVEWLIIDKETKVPGKGEELLFANKSVPPLVGTNSVTTSSAPNAHRSAGEAMPLNKVKKTWTTKQNKETCSEKLTTSVSPNVSGKANKLAEAVLTSMKNLKEEFNLLGRPGQHRFSAPTNYVPTFSEELVRILEHGTKQEIADEMDNILDAIVEDMTAKEGSGNKQYYRMLEAHLLLSFPKLNNALLRNNLRRRLKSKNKALPVEELSEDSEEDENTGLRVQKGAPRRTHTKDNCLILLRKMLSRSNREARRKENHKRVLDNAVAAWSNRGYFEQLGTSRWMRKFINRPAEEDCNTYRLMIKGVETEESLPGVQFIMAYRKTWPLRTEAMLYAHAGLDEILKHYPLLQKKAYVNVEAELYLSTEEKFRAYQNNVRLTWRAIELLRMGTAPEDNFKDYLASLGEQVVNFVHEAHLDTPPDRWSWPRVVAVSQTGEVIVKYKNHQWLEMDNVGEALGYAVLLMTVFDFPIKGRPQILLLMESMFFGYKPMGLRPQGVLMADRLRQLIQGDGSAQPAIPAPCGAPAPAVDA